MWWLIILILLVLLLVVVSWINSKPRKRQQSLAEEEVKIWTPGQQNGVKGKYYMVAMGVTPETASKLIKENLDPNKERPTEWQMEQASQALSAGSILFYFRGDEDTRPLQGNEASFLAPVGDIPDISSSEFFSLTSDGSIRMPQLTVEPLKVCSQSQVCTPGLIGYGQVISGDKLIVEKVADGIKLRRDGTREYLNLGSHLCPALVGRGKSSMDVRCQYLPNGIGGPRVASLSASGGEILYLE